MKLGKTRTLSLIFGLTILFLFLFSAIMRFTDLKKYIEVSPKTTEWNTVEFNFDKAYSHKEMMAEIRQLQNDLKNSFLNHDEQALYLKQCEDDLLGIKSKRDALNK